MSLSDGVRAAAVREDFCHREPEFFEIQARVLEGLRAVYDLPAHDWRAVTLGGSGTAALEAMMASLLPADARVLVVENGVYGERIRRVLDVHRIEAESLSHAWGEAPDLEALEQRLAGGGFSHLAMVHHETTTGRLNPVHAVAALCERYGVGLMLDTVSSFGAESIPFESPALEACAGTANKCLHGIPGLAFVLCRADSLRNGAPQRTLYLHLPDWAAKQQHNSTPYTPAVNSCLALDQALTELDEQGGWPARRERYFALAERLRRALKDLGIDPWLPEGESSCVLRSYRLPAGFDYASVHDGLKAAGFIIYEGQGGLASEMFRVSTMGAITDSDMDRLEAAFAKVFAPVPSTA